MIAGSNAGVILQCYMPAVAGTRVSRRVMVVLALRALNVPIPLAQLISENMIIIKRLGIILGGLILIP